jgi:hypothetical protein
MHREEHTFRTPNLEDIFVLLPWRAIAFLPQTRLRGGLEPAIQVFVQRDWCALRLAAKVAITPHLIR